MLLINGRKQNHISAFDRAVQFGDGSFTTARIIDGNICLYNAHLERLKESCEKLFIEFNKWDILEAEMYSLASKINYGIIKVIISRGKCSRGYSIDNCHNPSRIILTSSYPYQHNNWLNSGIKLALSPVRLGRNPMLAGIKHLNRLEQVLIRLHIKKLGADEALVLDSEGLIIECCTANLFWRQGNVVFTPRLDQAGVNGVMRRFCLKQLLHSPFHIAEVNAKPQALWNADEVLICNALISVVPVSTYEGKNWKSRKLYQFLAPLCNNIE